MDFTTLPDLASRALAGSVIAANDELFAEREALIRPYPPSFDPHTYGPKGKLYDGWETRRRREPGSDWAIVRLGAPGVVSGVVVDTAFFQGNYPPEISIEAACAPDYPSVSELLAGRWTTLVPRSPAAGNTGNSYPVYDPHRWTHIRLTIYPDGGVARLRVHGSVVPDPNLLSGTVDLAAAESGGRLLKCSNSFYNSPANLIMPGRARDMSDGWENARRRDSGNDYATFALIAAGRVRRIELDTSCFVGNAPGWAKVSGRNSANTPTEWTDLVAKRAVLPDTRHHLPIAPLPSVDQVRLDVFPDGGLSRLRVWGELEEEQLAALRQRWQETTPV